MVSRACAMRRADSVMGTGSRWGAPSLLGMGPAALVLPPALPGRTGNGVAPALHTLLSALPTACKTHWQAYTLHLFSEAQYCLQAQKQSAHAV